MKMSEVDYIPDENAAVHPHPLRQYVFIPVRKSTFGRPELDAELESERATIRLAIATGRLDAG